MLLAKTLEKPAEPTFQTVKVTPTKKPPTRAVDTVRPSLPLTNCTSQTGTDQLYNRSKCRLCQQSFYLTDQTDQILISILRLTLRPNKPMFWMSDLLKKVSFDQDKVSVTANLDRVLSEERKHQVIFGLDSCTSKTHLLQLTTTTSTGQSSTTPARYL